MCVCVCVCNKTLVSGESDDSRGNENQMCVVEYLLVKKKGLTLSMKRTDSCYHCYQKAWPIRLSLFSNVWVISHKWLVWKDHVVYRMSSRRETACVKLAITNENQLGTSSLGSSRFDEGSSCAWPGKGGKKRVMFYIEESTWDLLFLFGR